MSIYIEHLNAGMLVNETYIVNVNLH